MNTFLVTVLCAAHLHQCPIPNGYKMEHQAPSKDVCIRTARDIVDQIAMTMGLTAASFTIQCKEK